MIKFTEEKNEQRLGREDCVAQTWAQTVVLQAVEAVRAPVEICFFQVQSAG